MTFFNIRLVIDISCESAISFIGSGMKKLAEMGKEAVDARYQLQVGAWIGGTVYGKYFS